MQKQWLIYAFIFLLFSIFLSSCDQKDHLLTSSSDESDSKKVTLTIGQTFTRADEKNRLELLKKHIQQLENRNPDLRFHVSEIEQRTFRNQKLPIAMTVGNPPDIFDLFGGSDTERYAKSGRLLDLTDFLKRSGLKDRFVDGALDEFTVNGRIYGLPRGGYTEGFFYNKKIFRELGVKIPKTWHDLKNVIKKSKAAGYTPIALGSKEAWVPGMMLNALIIRNVGIKDFRNLVTGEYKWTNPQMVKAWQEFRQLNKMSSFPENTLNRTYGQQSKMFRQGKAAMVYTGSWDALIFTSNDSKSLKQNLGFFKFPAVPGGKGDQTSTNAGYSNGWGFSSDVTTAEKKMIHRFIKLTWSRKAQKKQLDQANVLPAVKLTNESAKKPVMEDVLQVVNQSTSIWPAYDAIVNKNVQNTFNKEIQKVIGQEHTPKQALQNIQKMTDKQLQSSAKVDGS